MDYESLVYIDRNGTDCIKWDGTKKTFGEAGLLPLWVADMDFQAPACVREAVASWAAQGAYGYYKIPDRYYKAFQRWEQLQHGYTVERDWIRFSPGIVSAIYWLVQMITKPGDAVTTLTPVYYPFLNAIKDNGRELTPCQLVNESGKYTMDFDRLDKHFADTQSKLLIFSSPHNPVGRVWTREELEAVVALCRKYNVVLVSDEIHHDFVFAPARHTPMGTLDEHVVTLTAPSKTFNLAGLQTAVAVIPDEELRRKWDDFAKKYHVNSGGTFGFLAGEAAYLHGADWLESAKETIYGNYLLMREKLLAALPELVIPPLEGTYLMWVDFAAYIKPEDQKEFFAKKCKLALDYGAWFRGDADTFVRFNLATSREIVEKAADAVIEAMKEKLDT